MAQPDWARVDVAFLADTIAEDLMAALARRGIRDDECYESWYRMAGDDDFDVEELRYKDFVAQVARNAVKFRGGFHKRKHEGEGETLM